MLKQSGWRLLQIIMIAGPAIACCVIYVFLVLTCAALPRATDYKMGGGGSALRTEFVPTTALGETWDGSIAGEPSCEQLRAMWRYSKRQSRATEITNEIPTYRDPFVYNVWEPYARPRSVGGGRSRSDNYVYGRIIHSPPRMPDRYRTYDGVGAGLIGTGHKGTVTDNHPRKAASVRLPGGIGSRLEQYPHYKQPSGNSFEQLRDWVRMERLRELQEQRKAEEAAERATALRSLASDYHGRTVHDLPTHQGANFESPRYGEPARFDKNMHLTQKKGRLLELPDLLETATKYADQDAHLYNYRSYPDTIPVSNTRVVELALSQQRMHHHDACNFKRKYS